MKYAVLTAKHTTGHCLWPSKKTDYTVANNENRTDVVAAFVDACRERGVIPGLYYCSWDNHNRFGSQTPSDKGKDLPSFTTSLYQSFQTAQLTELLTQHGSIGEVWIDIPGVLGRGYRTFLYNRISEIQPDIVIMMNKGIHPDTREKNDTPKLSPGFSNLNRLDYSKSIPNTPKGESTRCPLSPEQP